MITPGFLLINKPVDMTSFSCIKHLKRVIREKVKIGHAGTLDPFATGLLIVALGREATRLISRIMVMEKTYIATGKCGELTDTLDYTGTVIETTENIPSEQEIRNAMASFGSSYEQIPPIYSALQYEGERLYSLARKNSMPVEELQKIAESKKRVVQLYDVQLLSYEPPYFTIQARVSHGTYIRTLVNDIAVRACPSSFDELTSFAKGFGAHGRMSGGEQSRAGSCATTYQLARMAIGPFNLDQATDLEAIKTIEDVNRLIIPLENLRITD
jgi:tRNA pseudouridine55 synthase